MSWLRNWLAPLRYGPQYFHAGEVEEIRKIVRDEIMRDRATRELRGEE